MRKLAEIVGYGFIALVFIVGVIWAIDGGKRFWNDHGPAIQEAIDDIRPDFEFNFCIGEGCPDDESSDPDSTAAPQSIDEEALATLIAQKVVNDLRPEFANLATQEDVTNVEYKLDSILNQVIQGNTSIADLQTMLTNLRTDVSGLEGDAATAIQPAIDLLSDIVTRLKNGGTFTQADWNEFLGEWTTFIESRRGHYHRDNPAPRGTPDLGPIPSTNP